MTDIVERLKAGTGGGKDWMDLHEEAATEIERLRGDLVELTRLHPGTRRPQDDEAFDKLVGDTRFKFKINDRVCKIEGSYQATGKILARYFADDGSQRYVFRFDKPAGLQHIFNEMQLQLELNSREKNND